MLPPSEIGNIPVFASFNGRSWFLAVMNGVQPKQLHIPLLFLGKGNYRGTMVKDNAADPASLQVGEATMHAADYIDLDLVSVEISLPCSALLNKFPLVGQWTFTGDDFKILVKTRYVVEAAFVTQFLETMAVLNQ